MKQSLNGKWRLFSSKYDIIADVPGSFCNSLLKEGLIADPYYRSNEYETLPLFEDDITYERDFDLDAQLCAADRILLRFYGIDTLAEVLLNGKPILRSDNMHREYTCDITELVSEKCNRLTVKISSPTVYISKKNAGAPIWGVASTIPGYPHIRKAHYMFGWDWGPMLPDMGIWRDVELIGVCGGLIDSVYIRQDHSRISDNEVGLYIDVEASLVASCGLNVKAELTAPDGTLIAADGSISDKTTLSIKVSNAELWYPNGYGEQPLYGLAVRLTDSNGNILDERSMEIGLRTVAVSRSKLTNADGSDNGEEFAFVVNGIKIFSMGANYIPEDQLLPRRSPARTEELLKACIDANYNMIRVWGGGFYPDDWFYDLCDRMGLLVWQDFMQTRNFLQMCVRRLQIMRSVSEITRRSLCGAATTRWKVCGRAGGFPRISSTTARTICGFLKVSFPRLWRKSTLRPSIGARLPLRAAALTAAATSIVAISIIGRYGITLSPLRITIHTHSVSARSLVLNLCLA